MKIYTAICGGYEKPRDDVQCFTGPHMAFSSPRFHAKIYKVLSHLYVYEPDTLWIDGNIWPTVPVEHIERHFMGDGSDIGLWRHPYRNNVLEECLKVVEWGYESKQKIDDFIAHFGADYLKSLPLYECNVIARRNTPRTVQLNQIWWSLICRWGGRDQLTFPMALAQSRAKVHAVQGNVREHPMFMYREHGK